MPATHLWRSNTPKYLFDFADQYDLQLNSVHMGCSLFVRVVNQLLCKLPPDSEQRKGLRLDLSWNRIPLVGELTWALDGFKQLPNAFLLAAACLLVAAKYEEHRVFSSEKFLMCSGLAKQYTPLDLRRTEVLVAQAVDYRLNFPTLFTVSSWLCQLMLSSASPLFPAASQKMISNSNGLTPPAASCEPLPRFLLGSPLPPTPTTDHAPSSSSVAPQQDGFLRFVYYVATLALLHPEVSEHAPS